MHPLQRLLAASTRRFCGRLRATIRSSEALAAWVLVLDRGSSVVIGDEELPALRADDAALLGIIAKIGSGDRLDADDFCVEVQPVLEREPRGGLLELFFARSDHGSPLLV